MGAFSLLRNYLLRIQFVVLYPRRAGTKMRNKITDNWQKYLRENRSKKVEEKFSPDDFKDVYNTARMAHVGQTRRDGSEYFSHPSEVRNITAKFYPKDRVAQLAALLHDSLEDAPGSTVSSEQEMEEFIKGSIQDPAAGDEVIRVVRALTHEKGGDYLSYVVDLLGDVPTLRVKLSDMVHNLTDNPSPKQKAKYKSALDAIAQTTGGNAPQGISDDHWDKLMSLTSGGVSEKILDKEDGEYQRSVTKPVKMKEGEGTEGSMHRTSLMHIGNIAEELLDMIEDSDDLEEWVEGKITMAKEYLSDVIGHIAGRDARDDGEL